MAFDGVVKQEAILQSGTQQPLRPSDTIYGSYSDPVVADHSESTKSSTACLQLSSGGDWPPSESKAPLSIRKLVQPGDQSSSREKSRQHEQTKVDLEVEAEHGRERGSGISFGKEAQDQPMYDTMYESHITASNPTMVSFDEDSLSSLANSSQMADFESHQYYNTQSANVCADGDDTKFTQVHSSKSLTPVLMDDSMQRTPSYSHSHHDSIRRVGSIGSISSAPQFYDEEGNSSAAISAEESPRGTASAFGTSSDAIIAGSGNVSTFTSRMMTRQSSQALNRAFSNDSSTGTTESKDGQNAQRKKRNKCTPEQYRQLEAFFAKNRNPTGKVREELSKSIQMPERSVQVWFQNKRAKTKIMEIRDGVPPEQRTTVSKGKTVQTSPVHFNSAYKRRRTITQAPVNQEPVISLPVSSLCIGDWRRIKPLICLYSRKNQSFSWYLSSESVGFKLEFPLTCVRRLLFTGPRPPTIHEVSEGSNGPLGHFIVELNRPPQFYMEVFRSNAQPNVQEGGTQKTSWRQCLDFTEGKQATSVLTNIICGPYSQLRHAVLQLNKSGESITNLLEIREAICTDKLSWGTNAGELTSQGVNIHSVGPHNNFAPITPLYGNSYAQTLSPWEPEYAYHSSAVTHPVTPSSSNLDLSSLRIEAGRMGPMDAYNMGQYPVMAPNAHMGFTPWPQTAMQQSLSWGEVSDAERLDHIYGSGAASAPAYQAQGFEQQQQHHFPPTATGNTFFGNNSMTTSDNLFEAVHEQADIASPNLFSQSNLASLQASGEGTDGTDPAHTSQSLLSVSGSQKC